MGFLKSAIVICALFAGFGIVYGVSQNDGAAAVQNSVGFIILVIALGAVYLLWASIRFVGHKLTGR